MGEIDAAGELVTGALLGRVVERHAGEGHSHEAMCLNCGTALIGPHCHQCGQAGHVHRTLHAIGHEILHGVFHFEGKLWRTLPMLAWRPGELTRRYIAGERARFVSPMAIFLFSIFAMFAVFSWAGISAPTDIEGSTAKPAAAIEKARKETAQRVAKAREKLAEADAADPDRAVYARRISEGEKELKGFDAASRMLGRSDGEGRREVHTGWHALDHGIEKWQKNPSLMIYKLQSASYKFSWLLIPLSLPFVWLLFFWKREYRLYDHAIFVTYSIAFMSLLFIGTTLARAVGVPSSWIALTGMIVPFVHITRQLKQAYRLRWSTAILRALVLSSFIWIILMLFFAILLALGMFG